MNKYKIEKYIKNNYDENKYALIRVQKGYAIAFEDDTGVEFDNGYVIDNYEIYKISNNIPVNIKKNEIPKQDYDDLLKFLKFLLANGYFYKSYNFDDLPLSIERLNELTSLYEIDGLYVDDGYNSMMEEIIRLDFNDYDYDMKYNDIKEKYFMNTQHYYVAYLDEFIEHFYFPRKLKL